jgi:hypothetical protein
VNQQRGLAFAGRRRAQMQQLRPQLLEQSRSRTVLAHPQTNTSAGIHGLRERAQPEPYDGALDPAACVIYDALRVDSDSSM